ncbi:MAG: gluconokinase [Ramlibacter sp.]
MKRAVRPPLHVVVMGVSGAGKSAAGEELAKALGLPLVEGDEFHPPRNIEKMRQGLPLGDDDRAGWLDRLGQELVRHPQGAVLACSALKRAYRDKLRHAVPALRFVHLDLAQEQAQQRVAARGGHFYPTSLVASQFDALEDPSAEAGVLVVDASLPPEEVTQRAAEWLKAFRDDSTMRN